MPDSTEFKLAEKNFEALFNPLMLRILNPTLLRLNWNTFIPQIKAEKLAVWNSLQLMFTHIITDEDNLLYIYHKNGYEQLDALFRQLQSQADLINNTGFVQEDNVAKQVSRQTFRRARRTFYCIKRDTELALKKVSGELDDLNTKYEEREETIKRKISENFIVSNHAYNKLYIKSNQKWNRTKQTDDDYANQVNRRREENDKLTALETATNTYLKKRKTLVDNLKKGASKGKYKLSSVDIPKWHQISRLPNCIFKLNNDTNTIEFTLPEFRGVWDSWTDKCIQQLRNQTQTIKSNFKQRLDDCRKLVELNATEEIKYYHPRFQPLRF